MSHQLRNLIYAMELSERPANIPVSRPRGRKGAGLRYERELAKALPAARHGQWFQYMDGRQRRVCQTDLILERLQQRLNVVLECKYTWTLEGHLQLSGLYIPIVQMALHRPAVGVVVCRTLLPQTPREAITSRLDEAIEMAASGLPAVLHWLGGPLPPPERPPTKPRLDLASVLA